MNKRVDWIDNAKGIGIILVIYGHIAFRPEFLNVWLCSFHMPLFFFLAGITYNPEKYKNWGVFIKNKVKTLVIPYFLFSAVLWIWAFAKDILMAKPISGNLVLKRTAAIFIQIRGSEYGLGVWFVPCIFIAFILLHLIMRINSSRGGVLTSLILGTVCLASGYLYCRYIDIKLLWGIDAAFVAVFFMTLGCVFRKQLLASNVSKLRMIVVGAVIFGINVLFTALNYRIMHRTVGMWSNKYGNILFFLAESLSGTFFIIMVSHFIRLPYIKLIGKHSLYYYGVHIVFVEAFDLIVYKFLGNTSLLDNPVVAFAISTVIVTAVLLILSATVNVYERIYSRVVKMCNISDKAKQHR